MVTEMLQGWWRAERPIVRSSVIVNLAIALFCGLAAWFQWDVGLGAMTRVYLGYYAVLLGVYALIGVQLGADGRRARPLRLAADIGNWLGLAGFAILGLVLYDPTETGPLATFVGFFVVVAGSSVVKHLRTPKPAASI